MDGRSEHAVRMAADLGLALVVARDSNHFGAAAFWAQKMSAAGQIGIVMCNASPIVPPWQGKEEGKEGCLLNKDLILAMVRTTAPLETHMAKVTSKYQVTVPRKIADEYDIRPGDDIDWAPAGEVIRVIPPGKRAAPQGRESQLRLFDQATERHRKRPPARATGRTRGRGWKREGLYGRGRSR